MQPLSQPKGDCRLHAAQGRISNGLSPIGYGLAFLDWATHLANSPFQRMELARSAVAQWGKLLEVGMGRKIVEPTPNDHRFADPRWQAPPYLFFQQAFLLAEEWWLCAAQSASGAGKSNERIVTFLIRQMLDMVSPSNIPALNPEVIDATFSTGGDNLRRGARNLMVDAAEAISGKPAEPKRFELGRDLAATPGKIVFRNELIELIQYAPITAKVRKEPVLIVPAWIMKYYILDLSPQNSLIRYLVGEGHTVFAISWRNPGEDQRDLGLDDYRVKGIMAALDAIGPICGAAKVQACGYCLGGTLLSITAAAMARDGDERLASVTLFCAQTDFTEAGELQLFVTEDQVAFLEDAMCVQGYLDSRQMAGAFQLLRSNDLIWSRAVKSYFLGEREHSNDLMTWNADGTRMPARMHSEYLRQLFLNNDLAEGRFLVDGRPVSIGDISAPFFVVSTETDHIAPWRSVFKIHLLNGGDVTFVLTSGGHNAGVVSEPGHPHRRFRISRREKPSRYRSPEEWSAAAPTQEGSWWPSWAAWLDAHATGRVAPPRLGANDSALLADAPGRYVLEH